LKKLAVKMLKYGEMVSVCQENIKYFFISEATHHFGLTRAVQPKQKYRVLEDNFRQNSPHSFQEHAGKISF
jgi:hypothetical protein